MRPIALLSSWKIRNALRTTFRDPRKFGPLIVFSILMIASIGLLSLGFNSVPTDPTTGRAINPEYLRAVTTFCMIMLGLSVIDVGLGDSLLAFPMPDVDYLFPSPISRRIVLAYKLPVLTFNAIFFGGIVLLVYSSLTRFCHSSVPNPVPFMNPGWFAPLALTLSAGTYFNLAMFIAVRVLNRGKIHRTLIVGFITFGASLGIVWWLFGADTLTRCLNSGWIRWTFKPSSLASDTLVDIFSHRSAFRPVAWLSLGYMVSLIPMFLSNSNWYEQSIASSERISAFRAAAKGGISSLMAAKSSTFKHKAVRTYTIAPFGLGAMALFWAHLCAATKRPYANFVAPGVGGVALGALSAAVNLHNTGAVGMGYVILGGIGSYSTMAFMQIARTATEGTIRRRELLAPLPIKGWQSVAANLGVPEIAFFIFCLTTAITYGVSGAPQAGLVLVGFAVFMPIRMAARMTLQYVIVLGYPDLADKVQQVISVGVYAILSTPFLIAEVIFCVPALIFHSIWLGLVTLILLQIPILTILLLLAGQATNKAIATGEPVNVFRLFTRRA